MLISILSFVVGAVSGYMMYPAFYFVFYLKERFEKAFSIKRGRISGAVLVTFLGLSVFLVYLSIGLSFNVYLNEITVGATLGRYYGVGFFVGVSIFSLMIGRNKR